MADEVWSRLVGELKQAGVSAYFGVPSDEFGLLDAAVACGANVRTVRDQRHAAFAAIGFAQITGLPGVVALNSGPGFTNALTGLLEGASLGVPLLVVTTSSKADGIERGGFQVVPQERMVRPLNCWYYRLEQENLLAWAVSRAVYLTKVLDSGLAVLEIDEGSLTLGSKQSSPRQTPLEPPKTTPAASDLHLAAKVLAESSNILVLIGGGARSYGRVIQKAVNRWNAKVIATAAGRGAIDERDPSFVGVAGLYISAEAQVYVESADLVVVLGSALEETTREGWSNLGQVPVIQVDTNNEMFGRAIPAEIALWGDVGLSVAALLGELGDKHDKSSWPNQLQVPDLSASLIAATLSRLWCLLGPKRCLVQENGLHDMWSYDHRVLPVDQESVVVTPGEQTTMGFALPASVGAVMATEDHQLLLIMGDGAANASLSALPSLVDSGAIGAIVVLDNSGWGWPRVGREPQDRAITRFESRLPLLQVGEALGMRTIEVSSSEHIEHLDLALSDAQAYKSLLLVRIAVDDSDVPPAILRHL